MLDLPAVRSIRTHRPAVLAFGRPGVDLQIRIVVAARDHIAHAVGREYPTPQGNVIWISREPLLIVSSLIGCQAGVAIRCLRSSIGSQETRDTAAGPWLNSIITRTPISAERCRAFGVCVATLFFVFALLAADTARAASAVDVHENLDAPVVAWCVQDPGYFKAAAQVHGIDVGTGQTPTDINRGKDPVELLDWAALSDSKSRREVSNRVTAFAAFSRAALDVALDGVRRAGVVGPDEAVAQITSRTEKDEILGVAPQIAVGFGGILFGFAPLGP